MLALDSYKNTILTYLNRHPDLGDPKSLYEPIDYLLNLGGKKLRSTLVLMTAKCFGADVQDALPAAACIEVFHNFTLMHDDIMDGASLRRNKPSVHIRWDVNTAILSGDAMLIQAYECLNEYEDELFVKLIKQLSETALKVCEGQRWDLDFEVQSDVTLHDYLKMIELKTAVLVGCALKMGALVGEAAADDAEKMYRFGTALGMAFQIQDDYLDTFGDPAIFGKKQGGDIIDNKKTILFHKAFSLGTAQQKENLTQWFASKSKNLEEKIKQVSEIFLASGAVKATLEMVEEYSNSAFEILESTSISAENKTLFRAFGASLIDRKI